MEYTLTVNDSYIKLMHASVARYLETWPGGDPEEQQALIIMKQHLDKLLLEAMFDIL